MELFPHFCPYLSSYALICPYLPLFALICPYLPLYALICPYLSLSALICRYLLIYDLHHCKQIKTRLRVSTVGIARCLACIHQSEAQFMWRGRNSPPEISPVCSLLVPWVILCTYAASARSFCLLLGCP